MALTYDTFVAHCEAMNHRLSQDPNIVSLFEARDYGTWFQGVFMTDKFGGIGVIIRYFNGEWKFGDKVVTEDYILNCFDEVHKIMQEKTSARDLDALSEFINSQYY